MFFSRKIRIGTTNHLEPFVEMGWLRVVRHGFCRLGWISELLALLGLLGNVRFAENGGSCAGQLSCSNPWLQLQMLSLATSRRVRTARFRGSALSVEPWATVWAPFHGWPGNVGQGSGSISRLVSLRFDLGVFNGFTCGFFIIYKFSVGFLQNLFRVYWKLLSGMGFFTGVFMFKFTFYLGSLERWLMLKKRIVGVRKTRGPKNRLATVKPWRGGLRGGHRCRRHEAKAYKDRGGARGHRQIRGNTQLVKLTWTTSPMLEGFLVWSH